MDHDVLSLNPGNRTGCEGTRHLCECAQHFQSLQHLNISDNYIGKRGFRSLLTIMETCTSLSDLHLSGEQSWFLSRNMPQSIAMVLCVVAGNTLTPKCSELITKACSLHPSMRSLHCHSEWEFVCWLAASASGLW
jgi:Ran GTPase-activating protein (RanGAP) involved in mRNA processing and transport